MVVGVHVWTHFVNGCRVICMGTHGKGDTGMDTHGRGGSGMDTQ